MINTRRALVAVLWAVVAAVLTISTVQGRLLLLDRGFTPWQAWLLPAAVDVALVVALVGDQALASRGQRCWWGFVLRLLTAMTALVLNCGRPAIEQDWVAVGLHAVAPVLLFVTVEAATAYQRLLATSPALSADKGPVAAQLNGHKPGDVTSELVELVPDPDPLLDEVRSIAERLVLEGTTPNRKAVGEQLRAAGHSVSTKRLAALVRTVREAEDRNHAPAEREAIS
jgi:hypothetical protein